MGIRIRRTAEDSKIGSFINKEFSSYAEQNSVDLNYDEFCFAAESDDGDLLGVITGHALYNEVHISDLVIKNSHRNHKRKRETHYL